MQTADCTIWSKTEMDVIHAENLPMRILTVLDEKDNQILRTPCEDFTDEQLKSEELKSLVQNMLATVDYPDSHGVGVAGPQVGLSRRIVALQRQDKPGKPFEAYVNIRILAYHGEKKAGREGCLSVPGKRGVVERYRDIEVQYVDPYSLETRTERIKGFTSVIFQHECEHLDGTLYIDKCAEVMDFEPES